MQIQTALQHLKDISLRELRSSASIQTTILECFLSVSLKIGSHHPLATDHAAGVKSSTEWRRWANMLLIIFTLYCLVIFLCFFLTQDVLGLCIQLWKEVGQSYVSSFLHVHVTCHHHSDVYLVKVEVMLFQTRHPNNMMAHFQDAFIICVLFIVFSLSGLLTCWFVTHNHGGLACTLRFRVLYRYLPLK